jgi:hypothetical protein
MTKTQAQQILELLKAAECKGHSSARDDDGNLYTLLRRQFPCQECALTYVNTLPEV